MSCERKKKEYSQTRTDEARKEQNKEGGLMDADNKEASVGGSCVRASMVVNDDSDGLSLMLRGVCCHESPLFVICTMVGKPSRTKGSYE